MPKTEPEKLFKQYCDLLGRYASNVPKDPKVFREQMAEKSYEKLTDIEKVMLFLAIREEKRGAGEDASWIQFNYKNLADPYKIDGHLIKSQTGFIAALENYVGGGFTIDVVENETLLKSFRGTEHERLVRDVGEILGKGKEIDKGLSDPESVKRANQLASLLKRFGYEAADLEKTEPKEVSGSAEYQTMVKTAFDAYRAARKNLYEPKMGDKIVEACIAYNKGKKSVRMTEYGRKRFDDSLHLMATFADPNNSKVRENINRINQVRKTKPGDRNYVDLARYGAEGSIARTNAELLQSTRAKARAAVADILTGKGAQEAKELYMLKHAEEKRAAYCSPENTKTRALVASKQGHDHLTDIWAREFFKNTPKLDTARRKPEGEQTAAEFVCVHLAQAYLAYNSLSALTQKHVLITDPRRTNNEAKNQLFEQFKEDISLAYTTMRLHKPNDLMSKHDISSAKSTSQVMQLDMTDDISKIDSLGGSLLRMDGSPAKMLDNLDSKAMTDMDKLYNIADPTGYVTGRFKKADDFLENKAMTRGEHSENLLKRTAEVTKEYKTLADYHPGGKPITEDMALLRNTVAYDCVADKVMTHMYPDEASVPDMKKVYNKVDAMLKKPAFAEKLSVGQPDSDFGSRIETLVTGELTLEKKAGGIQA